MVVEHGSAYVSSEMKRNVESSFITLNESPFESPGTIGVVARYHAPLHVAFERIKSDYVGKESDKLCLTMSDYAVNSTVGAEGFGPMSLV